MPGKTETSGSPNYEEGICCQVLTKKPQCEYNGARVHMSSTLSSLASAFSNASFCELYSPHISPYEHWFPSHKLSALYTNLTAWLQ